MLSKVVARLCAVAIATFAVAASAAESHEYKVGALKIDHPWVRTPPPAAKVAGGFMKITNTGTAPDRLIGGSAAIAGKFEVHEMSVVDGVMRMRQLKPGLDIAPGATVELKPGGYHVMLMDLKAKAETGKAIKGTLVFEKAGTVEIEFKVEAPQSRAGSGSGSGKGGKGSGSHGSH